MARNIKAQRGKELRCKSWQPEAGIREAQGSRCQCEAHGEDVCKGQEDGRGQLPALQKANGTIPDAEAMSAHNGDQGHTSLICLSGGN